MSHRFLLVTVRAATALAISSSAALALEEQRSHCVAPLAYLPLDGSVVGFDAQGVPALGTYERVSPDGRFILRSYSGAKVGTVSLMELPAGGAGPIRVYSTPFSNEAFPVQGTWRYLVDVNGEHYRFADVLRRQGLAKPLFRAGMTGFYAAASELRQSPMDLGGLASQQTIQIRSLSWPQNADADSQGVGPLQAETIEVQDDGRIARVKRTTGPRFICSNRRSEDGGVFALPMISIDGLEFSAIPQSPNQGQPSMRVYGLSPDPLATGHPCDLRADLGMSPSKAVFGYAPPAAWLTYSDLGSVYVFDRALKQSFRMDSARERTLVSAFPGLTRDGRVVYGATWRDCTPSGACESRAGYVIADPYQSASYRAFWQARGQPAPKACITQEQVSDQRKAFAQKHGLAE